MKPVLNPRLVQIGFGILGAVCAAIAHLNQLTWQTALAAAAGVIFGGGVIPRAGDVAVSTLPKDVQDSIRPPAPPSNP
jgi:hypothetical protein